MAMILSIGQITVEERMTVGLIIFTLHVVQFWQWLQVAQVSVHFLQLIQ